MAAIFWKEIRGQEFSDEEARMASDFSEIISNFALEPSVLYQMFKDEVLPVAKRLVLAQMVSVDDISAMLLQENDKRIIEVIQHRLREARENGNSGIVD